MRLTDGAQWRVLQVPQLRLHEWLLVNSNEGLLQKREFLRGLSKQEFAFLFGDMAGCFSIRTPVLSTSIRPATRKQSKIPVRPLSPTNINPAFDNSAFFNLPREHFNIREYFSNMGEPTLRRFVKRCV
jgi:hypothetical protein